MLDLKIRTGVILDGAKMPRYQADLGTQGDYSVNIDNLPDNKAQATRDVTGDLIAPRVIEINTHPDRSLSIAHRLWIVGNRSPICHVYYLIAFLRANNKDLFDSRS